MGIKNFMKWVNRYAPGSIELTNLDKMSNKVLGVDASLLMYKAELAIKGNGFEMRNNNGKITSHLYVSFFSIIRLLKNNIIPIYVFDGKPNKLKNFVLHRRELKSDSAKLKLNKLKQIKKRTNKIKKDINKLEIISFDINVSMENDLIKMLDLMGIPHIKAKNEADSLLAYMEINKYIDGVISDDTDIIIFGTNNLYKNVSTHVKTTKSSIQHISYEKIIDHMKWKREQLVNLAILLGSDYAPTIKGVGMVKLTELINNNYTLNDILNEYKVYNKDRDQIILAKKFMLDESFNLVKYVKINCELNKMKYGQIHPNKLYNFLVKDNQLDDKRVSKQIIFLKNILRKDNFELI